MHHRGGANDEGWIALAALFLALEPKQIGEGLQRFTEAHVVCKNTAEAHAVEVHEKIEALLLVRPELGIHARGQVAIWYTLKTIDAVAQLLRLFAVAEAAE